MRDQLCPEWEKAVEKSDPSEVIDFINNAVGEEIRERFKHVMHTKKYDTNNVKAARMYVQKFLGLTPYSHHLYQNIKGGGEHGKSNHEHKHEE